MSAETATARSTAPGPAWRGTAAIAATYVAFLLFAQFGFLSQLKDELGGDVEAIRTAMAAMGLAGLLASLGTAGLLGRVAALDVVRAGFVAVAAIAGLSVVCHGVVALTLVAAAIGAAIGLLTVALATALPEIAPRGATGRVAGFGTGIAYLVSNLPFLFEATPAIRALVPAALALVAAALLPAAARRAPSAPAGRDDRFGLGFGLPRLLAVFLILVWLDSAAFAIVQANPALKGATWGSAGLTLLQGTVHLLAAIAGGVLLDLGFGLAVPLLAWGLFAIAFPLLDGGGPFLAAAGPLYAIGISLYSTALVALPSRSPRAGRPGLSTRWRAGLLFGIAGWLGSALGVGMAQDLGRIPGWFLVATGIALAAAVLLRAPARWGAREFALAGIAAVAAEALLAAPTREEIDAGGTLAAERRGRRVYVQEGCVHCHSQYVRAGSHDEVWWGPARPLDRSLEPVLLGARRQGPDLLEVGNRRSPSWQELHLRDPRALNPGSRMPSYAHLFAGDGQRGGDLVAYLSSLGAETAAERAAAVATRASIAPLPDADRARGAALFAAFCASCHGEAGRGDGRFARTLADPFLDLRKEGFHNLPAAEDDGPGPERERWLARVIRFGLAPKAMPGHEWLTDQQIADLAAFTDTLPAPLATRSDPR